MGVPPARPYAVEVGGTIFYCMFALIVGVGQWPTRPSKKSQKKFPIHAPLFHLRSNFLFPAERVLYTILKEADQ